MSLDVQSVYELPMRALHAAESQPPLRKNPNDITGIQGICDALIGDLAMPRRGEYSDTLQSRIGATKQITRALLAREGVTSESARTGKEKAAIKQANQVEEVLRSFGIDVSEIDIDDAFILKELAEALEITNKMVDAAEPMFDDTEVHTSLTADAIANWMDMFIKLHQRFSLEDHQVTELFNHLFVEGKINKLLRGGQRDRIFTQGLFGELSAYLHLYREKMGQGKFAVPQRMHGAGTAIDLIWEHDEGPEAGIEYYDVKSDINVGQPILVDVADGAKYAAYVSEMIATYSHHEQVLQSRLRSADRLRAFAAEARGRNPSARFYSMRVPSLARKDTI